MIRGFQEWQPTIITVPYPYSNSHDCHSKQSETYQSLCITLLLSFPKIVASTQLVLHRVIFIWAIDKVSEQVAHFISGHLPPTGMHSIVCAHGPRLEVGMRQRYEAVLSRTSCVRLCALKGWMPVAPTIQARVVYVGCSMRASSRRASWPPTSLRRPPIQWAVCIVACRPISDTRIKEVRRNFSLLPIIVKVGSNAQGYPSSSQLLFDPIFLLVQLSFC